MPQPTSSYLPQEYVKAKAEARGNIIALSMFALVLAGVVGAFLVTDRTWRSVRDRGEDVSGAYVLEEQRVRGLMALEEQRASIMEKAEIVAALIERVPRWALLGEMTMRMPMGRSMLLTTVELKSKRVTPIAPAAPPNVKSLASAAKSKARAPEKPRIQAPRFEYTLRVIGMARANNDIADYLASLKASPALDRVELQFIEDARRGDEDLRKFEITATIRDNVNTTSLASSLSELLQARTAMVEPRPAPTGPSHPVTTAPGDNFPGMGDK